MPAEPTADELARGRPRTDPAVTEDRLERALDAPWVVVADDLVVDRSLPLVDWAVVTVGPDDRPRYLSEVPTDQLTLLLTADVPDERLPARVAALHNAALHRAARGPAPTLPVPALAVPAGYDRPTALDAPPAPAAVPLAWLVVGLRGELQLVAARPWFPPPPDADGGTAVAAGGTWVYETVAHRVHPHHAPALADALRARYAGSTPEESP
jgi:hypothetical protein